VKRRKSDVDALALNFICHLLRSATLLSILFMAKKDKKKKNDKPTGNQSKTIADNRKARHRFEITEQFECGVVLIGSEVKSIREGNISLNESYVRVEKGELWLVGADIAEYRQASFWNHQPKRSRKLLVKRRELQKLTVIAFEKGLTLVPLKMYFNNRGIVKVLVGVGRGKKLHDKRQSLKDADNKRRLNREMRERRK
jgi:SsrA-binding protein